MGMNYYVDVEKPCPDCDRDHICQVHLGKSSGGWKFLFATEFPEHHGIFTNELTMSKLKGLLTGMTIRDESGERVDREDFWSKVESKQQDRDHVTDMKYPQYYVEIEGYDFMRGHFS